jgi:hypothetical protein
MFRVITRDDVRIGCLLQIQYHPCIVSGVTKSKNMYVEGISMFNGREYYELIDEDESVLLEPILEKSIYILSYIDMEDMMHLEDKDEKEILVSLPLTDTGTRIKERDNMNIVQVELIYAPLGDLTRSQKYLIIKDIPE